MCVKWKSLSHVWLFVTPWTVALQAPLSMEFSSLEYWSGLSFPSPGCLPDLVIKPGSPALQPDSLPTEPQGKPKNTGVGSLLLPQQIFLTQELNWGLLHCSQILYQLSYQGSPSHTQYYTFYSTFTNAHAFSEIVWLWWEIWVWMLFQSVVCIIFGKLLNLSGPVFSSEKRWRRLGQGDTHLIRTEETST